MFALAHPTQVNVKVTLEHILILPEYLKFHQVSDFL
jgi:hypothetical protein